MFRRFSHMKHYEIQFFIIFHASKISSTERSGSTPSNPADNAPSVGLAAALGCCVAGQRQGTASPGGECRGGHDGHGDNVIPVISTTWWLIPLSKWVITPVINGISKVNPLITGVITHLLSGMSHQVPSGND